MSKGYVDFVYECDEVFVPMFLEFCDPETDFKVRVGMRLRRNDGHYALRVTEEEMRVAERMERAAEDECSTS